MKILVIIPAKLDSKRLFQKNLSMINGKTLVEHSIEYAKNSKHLPTIIISSESEIMNEIASKNDVLYHKRSTDLCGDTEVVDVYINLIKNLDEKYDIVVGLQPDNPDRVNTLDDCIEYMVSNNYDDIITIDESYRRSGAIRLFKYSHLVNEHVSKRIGCIKETATDIHTKDDLEKLRNRINE